MAIKYVDETKLNAAMTYEADKIREKLGSSAQLDYDLENEKGFGDYIDAIPSGGGSQGLIDLVVNFTDSGNRTWAGTIEGNAIKNFTTSGSAMNVPLVLKQPVVVSPGDIITMTLSNVDVPSSFFADFTMHRVCVLESVAGGGREKIAVNFRLANGETAKSLTYSGDAVMIWSFSVNARTSGLNLTYADVHIDINNTRLF